MREQVELGREAGRERERWTRASRGLRLVEPWSPDLEPGGRRGRAREDRSAQVKGARRHLTLVSVDEAQLERPSAVVVMRLLLDAWRSAERQLALASEGSPERPDIQARVATLRLLYQGLFAYVRTPRPEATRV